MTWERGEWIVRREVLNDGRAWQGCMVVVVEDTPAGLVTYLPAGTQLGFPPGPWPIEGGVHPWELKGGRWEGHGTLMVQRPGDDFAVWHFWHGEQREFSCWYLNIQERFRRTPIGYDTQDLELDIVVRPDGHWELKDDDLLDVRVSEGRFDVDQATEIRAIGRQLIEQLEAGGRLWDDDWSAWQPPPAWEPPPVGLPDGWAEVPPPWLP